MRLLGDRILDEDGPREGSVRVDEHGRVQAIEPPADYPEIGGLVVPAPVDAHTHLADHAARGKAEGLPLEEAVAPPDGLKHRWLREADRSALVDSFADGLHEVARSGAHRAIDFREQGPDGARIAHEAASNSPVDLKVLGRPSSPSAWPEEADELAMLVDGIGISGLNDQPLELSQAQADWCQEHDLVLGLHLSEAEHEDLDAALALDPDLLVHGTHFTDEDAGRVADAGVPLVLCPRSNALFGQRPPVERLVEAGVELALGTDNAMFHPADVWTEAAWLVDHTDVEPDRAVAMACTDPLETDREPAVEEGRRVVLLEDRDGLDRALTERSITIPWRESVAGTRS